MDGPKLYIFAFVAIGLYALLIPMARKFAIIDFPPFAFMTITMFFLTIFSAIGCFLFEKNFSYTGVGSDAFTYMAVFALINCLGYYLEVVVLKHMPSTNYQLMQMVTPVIGGLFAWYLLREGLSFKILLGFFVMCIGFYIAVAKKPFVFMGSV